MFDLKRRCAARSLYQSTAKVIQKRKQPSALLSIALTLLRCHSTIDLCCTNSQNLVILGKLEILARTCPQKMVRLVTLLLKEDFINSDIVNKSELGIRTCSVNAACKSWSQEHNRFHCDMGNVKCENLVIIYYALCARRFGRALCLHLMSFPASCAQHHVPKSERFLKIPRSGLFFIIPLPLFLHLHLHLCI